MGTMGFALGTMGLVIATAGEPATIKLFNGKNLEGWSFYTTEAKNENPGLFEVVGGMLKIAGGKEGKAYLGGMITSRSYSNYRLVVDYRWGGPTFGARSKASRDSGILLHCVGPSGPGPWPTSVECQIIEGGTGDIILIGGKDDAGLPVVPSATVAAIKRGGEYYYQPDGAKVTVHGGRINWFGRDPQWRDVLDFRGKRDVESPGQEWTRVECVCRGASLTNIVNGVTVNHVDGLALQSGKILLQTEGAEIWFRTVELTPLQ